jgi:hypothetical protein
VGLHFAFSLSFLRILIPDPLLQPLANADAVSLHIEDYLNPLAPPRSLSYRMTKDGHLSCMDEDPVAPGKSTMLPYDVHVCSMLLSVQVSRSADFPLCR